MTVGDWASFAVAAATLVLAFFTRRAVVAAKDGAAAARGAARAAQDGVAASRDQAEATAQLAIEARTDRQLVWSPLLIPRYTGNRTRGTGAWTEEIVVHNVGGGPAYDCICFVEAEGGWGFSPFDPLGGGDRDTVQVSSISSSGRQEPQVFWATPGGAWRSPQNKLLVIASDVFGSRWRFLDGLPPEVYRGVGPVPEWAAWRP